MSVRRVSAAWRLWIASSHWFLPPPLAERRILQSGTANGNTALRCAAAVSHVPICKIAVENRCAVTWATEGYG